MKKRIARVVVKLFTKKFEKQEFDYIIPPSMQSLIQIGSRVKVPLGNQVCEGFIISFPNETKVSNLKSICELIDEKPLISQEMVEVAKWVSERYLCSLYKVLEYVLPPSLRNKKEKWVKLIPESNSLISTLKVLDPLVDEVIEKLKQKPQKVDNLLKAFGEEVENLLIDLKERGIVEIYDKYLQQGKPKINTIIEPNICNEDMEQLITDKLKRAPKQVEILKYLLSNGPTTVTELRKIFGFIDNVLKGLEKKGLIIKNKLREQRFPELFEEFKNNSQFKLNSYQEQASKKIKEHLDKKVFTSFLLHGVTGSGKTEVYLECIKHVLKQGREAIVLVPEISLTPQTVGRFSSVLGEQVKVLHSNMSLGERMDVWESFYSGRAKVVVGVRSAIFAPLKNLGLIIIDEEHETTYKQSEPIPRYHARHVAIKRAQLNDAVLVLGSATPSIESYYKAKSGDYLLLEIPKRATNNPLPDVEIVDLRNEFKKGNRSIFSLKLQKSIEERLYKNEQIILFLNRRGYSTFVLCRECGKPLQCKNCSITMTYHRYPNIMKCHYCDSTYPVPRRCPHCGSSFIRYFGAGTQLIEDELKKIWPDVKITRIDVDSIQNKDSHQKLLAEFKKGKSSVLIGTQMIAKGLNFPNVTLVGVIAADTTLNLPDYKSSEKTFQLLTQVAGRAGRGEKGGKVIIQTYNPEHYAVLCGKKQDYLQFYNQELNIRKLMDYPPFSILIRILITDFYEEKVKDCANRINLMIKEKYKNIEILGPAPAPIVKIKNRYRWQIILKGNKLEQLSEVARFGYLMGYKGETSNTLRIIIDVEPESIL